MDETLNEYVLIDEPELLKDLLALKVSNKDKKKFPVLGKVQKIVLKYEKPHRQTGLTMFCYRFTISGRDFHLVFTERNNKILDYISVGSIIAFYGSYYEMPNTFELVIQNTGYFDADMPFLTKGIENKKSDFEYDKIIKALLSIKGRENLKYDAIVELLKKQNFRCALTNRILSPHLGNKYSLSIDKIVPGHNGGKYTIDNIQLVTSSSNTAKSTLDLNTFLEVCCDVYNSRTKPTSQICLSGYCNY